MCARASQAICVHVHVGTKQHQCHKKHTFPKAPMLSNTSLKGFMSVITKRTGGWVCGLPCHGTRADLTHLHNPVACMTRHASCLCPGTQTAEKHEWDLPSLKWSPNAFMRKGSHSLTLCLLSHTQLLPSLTFPPHLHRGPTGIPRPITHHIAPLWLCHHPRALQPHPHLHPNPQVSRHTCKLTAAAHSRACFRLARSPRAAACMHEAACCAASSCARAACCLQAHCTRVAARTTACSWLWATWRLQAACVVTRQMQVINASNQ